MTEDILQEKCVKWFRSTYSYKSAKPFSIIFSVPNGGKRSWFDAKQLQATGVLAGVPDLIIEYNGNNYYVEMKTQKGRLNENQKRFKLMLEMTGGASKWFLVRSFEEFKEIVKRIIK